MERFAKTFISTNKVGPQREHLAPGTDLGTSGLFNVSREDRLPAKAEAQAIPKVMGEMLGITRGTQLSPKMKPLCRGSALQPGQPVPRTMLAAGGEQRLNQQRRASLQPGGKGSQKASKCWHVLLKRIFECRSVWGGRMTSLHHLGINVLVSPG